MPVDNKHYINVCYCSLYYYVSGYVLDAEDILVRRPTKTLIKEAYIHMGGRANKQVN